jgi:nodulation protein E
MTKSFRKALAEDARATHPKTASKTVNEKADDVRRKSAPRAAAQKAGDPHGEAASKVASEKALVENYRKVSPKVATLNSAGRPNTASKVKSGGLPGTSTHTNGRRRVVVTGQGVVTPLGTGVDKFWAALKKGECGIRQVQSFPTEDLYITIAGEVPDFDPKERLQSKPLLLADKFSQYAGCAAQEAVAISKLEVPLKDNAAYRAACIIGSGVGGLTTLEFSYKMLFKENKRASHPLTLLKAIGSSASAHVSIEYAIKGPTFGVVSACSTATHAIGLTYRMIREGLVDLGVAGAAEASLNWGATRAWQAMRVLSPDGLWPFAKNRNGTVLAEGAGVLMLEELEHAKARGAPILAELMGYGMTADAADMVNPSIDGASMAMQQALDDAGLAPSDIDYVNAHGTATAVNDVNETRAIKRVFGNAANKLSISSTKSMHGHCLGAGGGIEAVAAVKAIGEGFVPPTVGLDEPDPECDLDYTPNVGKKREINYAMSNSFAFGGLNAVLVFGPAPA